MKKILPNNKKTARYLNSLPKIYIVACWSHWGVRDYPFSGKWIKDDRQRPIPLVYVYEDCNGVCDEYRLVPINYVTTGVIKDWSFYKSSAEKYAELLNMQNY